MLTPGDVFRNMSGLTSWLASIALGLAGAILGYLIFTVGLGIGDDDVFDFGGIISAIIGKIVLLIAGFFCAAGVRPGQITGVHALVFSEDAEAVRAFLRDVLGLRSVDAGGGWLIFPAGRARRPSGRAVRRPRAVPDVRRHHRHRRGAEGQRGRVRHPRHRAGLRPDDSPKLPGGGELGLYEPRHPTAIERSPDTSGSGLA